MLLYSTAFACVSKDNEVILHNCEMPSKREWNRHQQGLTKRNSLAEALSR